MNEQLDSHHYQAGISRRDSLKWLALLAAGASVPALSGCRLNPLASDSAGHWPDLQLAPITARGYGKDPNLILPPESPWPRTLTQAQLDLVAVLADIIVPQEGVYPSATQVHVPDVIDEWVSAPYEGQQRDRIRILHGLAWLDDEANLRYQRRFVALSAAQQLVIVDDIAFDNAAEPFVRMADVFARLRSLVLAAYFCTPQGMQDIGYMGNVPIAGDYPGPSDEALHHLHAVLAGLNLSQYAYMEERL